MSYQDEKQKLIVRQSSLTRALEFYKLNNVTPSLTDVVLCADVLTDYVMTGSLERVKKYDNHYKLDNVLERLVN